MVLRRIFGSKREKLTENGENYIMRSLMIVLLIQYCSGNEIEKNKMGGACSTYVVRGEVYTGV
jgi:hypothetical protein